MNLNLEKIERLLDEAQQLPLDQRAAFLEAACEGDETVRREVEALLAADAAAGSFLSANPKADLPAGTLNSPGTSLEGPGTVIGRYKLLEQIGEGGYGVVYLAEQLEPVKRRVAFKIIKPGMDSRQVIGRFEAERQALALMDHPNIAKIFDAGLVENPLTPSLSPGGEGGARGADEGDDDVAPSALSPQPSTHFGRPYFVMELIKGIPITKFCEEQQLDTAARLDLLIVVCSAVQHAHQKGIIHRDLKPSNILVTLHGEEPVPKVIDFGIAKATEQPLTEKTVFTQFQQFLGTPAYMSPEQAEFNGSDIDTRSDIYSLGVLLYELLTGSPPFDAKELLSGGLDEMRRIIREKEPMLPSTRLSRMLAGDDVRRLKSKKQVAEEVRASSRRRLQGVKEDLDWIVMKALEKDRARRYETANGLAADLKRHLNNEPVTAVAPTLVYQLTKFYQRNRRVAQVAGAFGALLLIATLFSTWQAVRARKAETRAVAEAATAQNVAEFFWKGLIKQLSPWNHTNRDVRLRDALDVAAGQVEDSLKDDPAAEATVRIAFGKAYGSLSKLPLAETNLLRAVALRRARLGDFHELTAEALDGLSGVYEFQGRFAESERALEEVVRIRERVFGKHHPSTVTAAARATFFRIHRLPPAEASRQLESTLAELRRDVGPDSDIYRKVLNQWGWLLLAQDELDQALQVFDEAHRMAVAKDGAESVSALWSLGLRAATRARQGRHDEAEATFRRITAIHERICGPDHVITRDGRITMVGAVFLPQERFDEAAEILLETARAEHQQLQYLRPATKGTIRALTNAWQGAGGGPGFDAFQNQIEPFRETSVMPEP